MPQGATDQGRGGNQIGGSLPLYRPFPKVGASPQSYLISSSRAAGPRWPAGHACPTISQVRPPGTAQPQPSPPRGRLGGLLPLPCWLLAPQAWPSAAVLSPSREICEGTLRRLITYGDFVVSAARGRSHGITDPSWSLYAASLALGAHREGGVVGLSWQPGRAWDGPPRVTRVCCLERIAQPAIVESAEWEIGPSKPVRAPQDSA
jgi:hypothetical protein